MWLGGEHHVQFSVTQETEHTHFERETIGLVVDESSILTLLQRDVEGLLVCKHTVWEFVAIISLVSQTLDLHKLSAVAIE